MLKFINNKNRYFVLTYHLFKGATPPCVLESKTKSIPAFMRTYLVCNMCLGLLIYVSVMENIPGIPGFLSRYPKIPGFVPGYLEYLDSRCKSRYSRYKSRYSR